MPPFQPGCLVLFTRNTPSKWSNFVDTGSHIRTGDVGVVTKNYTTAVGEKRVTVYEVFVSGLVTKAWEDELMRSP